MNALMRLYRFLFARAFFVRLNTMLYRLGLHGIGVMNFESSKISGEQSFLKEYLADRVRAVVIDVGANVGDFSRSVLDFIPDAVIFAFEPHPETFSRLAGRFERQNFTAVEAAVGSEPGVLELYDYRVGKGSTHASLYRDVIEVFHASSAVEQKVKVVTLDEFASSKNLDEITLLKIDAEGHELAVLKGAKNLIERRKIEAIQFEFNALHVFSRAYFRDFWDLLPEYDFYRLLPSERLKIEQYRVEFCEIFAYQNIVAIRKSHE